MPASWAVLVKSEPVFFSSGFVLVFGVLGVLLIHIISYSDDRTLMRPYADIAILEPKIATKGLRVNSGKTRLWALVISRRTRHQDRAYRITADVFLEIATKERKMSLSTWR